MTLCALLALQVGVRAWFDGHGRRRRAGCARGRMGASEVEQGGGEPEHGLRAGGVRARVGG